MKTATVTVSAFLLVLSYFVSAAPPSEADALQALISKEKEAFATCAKKDNLDEDKYWEHMKKCHLPEKREGKCFLSCIMNEFGYFKDGGKKVDWELWEYNKKLMKGSKPDTVKKIKEVSQKCQADFVANEDLCEQAYEIVKCVSEEFKKVGLCEEKMQEKSE